MYVYQAHNTFITREELVIIDDIFESFLQTLVIQILTHEQLTSRGDLTWEEECRWKAIIS